MVGRKSRSDETQGATRSKRRCPADEAISDLGDAEDALAERLDGSHYRDDYFCGCCSSAAIPSCRRPSRSRWRCASSQG